MRNICLLGSEVTVATCLVRVLGGWGSDSGASIYGGERAWFPPGDKNHSESKKNFINIFPYTNASDFY